MDFLCQVHPRPRVVIESTASWYWLYDLLYNHGFEVVVSNPRQTKAIASARINNDKLDSQMLAQLLRVDMVAPVHVSDFKTRALKELLRSRARLVRDASRYKVRIRSLLAKNNVSIPGKRLFGRGGGRLLRGVDLPEHHLRPIRTYLLLHDSLQETIEGLDQEVRQRAKDDPQAQLLMSIPGVGPVVALTILAEVGDISRFRSHRQLASYAGLVSSLHSSAGVDRHGRITKQGSVWLRTALVEAAHVVGRMRNCRINIFFRKRIVKGGYKKAVVATARRILQFSFYVLRDQRPYVEELETSA